MVLKKVKKFTHTVVKNELQFIQSLSNTEIVVNDEKQTLHISGENKFFIDALIDLIDEQHRFELSREELTAMYNMAKNTRANKGITSSNILHLTGLCESVRFKSNSQKIYASVMQEKYMVFASGPAGTGKTHLAAALGLDALLNKRVRKLILSRPVIEAGESLGFLPGDMKDKLDPYLRPLYDELLTWIDTFTLEKYIMNDLIEIAPLAYMRGRTFNNSWIILDEAQNTTIAQMKMILTRLGRGSTLIITGDPGQIDLRPHIRSGFIDALERLKNIPEIAFVNFAQDEIIRHPILQKIIDAYDR